MATKRKVTTSMEPEDVKVETPVVQQEFPTIKFIVDDNDLVDVSIIIAAIKDDSGNFRPRPILRDMLVDQKGIFETRVKEIETEISQCDEPDEKRRLELTAELLAFNNVLADINNILSAPYKEYTSQWKRASWRDLSQINVESYAESASGASVWSEERHRDAKLKHLLKDWDLTQEGPAKRQFKIPVNQAFKCDGAVINAFIQEYDRKISLTKEEAGN